VNGNKRANGRAERRAETLFEKEVAEAV